MRTIALLLLFSCSARVAQIPSSHPTDLDDYDDIPQSRCSPELHGMYLSYSGGNAILESDAKVRRSCERTIERAETGRKLAELRCPACEKARNWATAGVVLTVGAGILTIGVGTLVIKDFLGRELK